MIVLPDNVLRAGWALQDPKTKAINLAMICEGEAEAHALLAGMRLHQPHRGEWQIVTVFVAVTPAQ